MIQNFMSFCKKRSEPSANLTGYIGTATPTEILNETGIWRDGLPKVRHHLTGQYPEVKVDSKGRVMYLETEGVIREQG